MTYLVRHLSSRPNPSLSTRPRRGASGFWAASDALAAVMDVEAHDQHLDAESINAKLKSGALRSTDLVRVGGEWVSLTDFEPAMTEALKAATREHRRRMLQYTGYMAIIVAGYVLRFWDPFR